MGRTASGVKGIELKDDQVIGAETVKGDEEILIVTEKGYGKKTSISELQSNPSYFFKLRK